MKSLFKKLIIVLLVFVAASWQLGKPKIKLLIIGDSISIGYTPFVQKNLRNIADVYHNPGNAQHTGTGIDSIETWIGENQYEIIQFNWGLWDLCYRSPDSMEQGNRDKINGKLTYSVDDYGNNLDLIVKMIRKKSNAELIFVTTTYVPEGEAGRFKEDVIKYNEIAKKVMVSNKVKINDIYEKSMMVHHDFGKEMNDVHYLPKGYEKLAAQISDFLENEIKKLAE